MLEVVDAVGVGNVCHRWIDRSWEHHMLQLAVLLFLLLPLLLRLLMQLPLMQIRVVLSDAGGAGET